jgi:hypothetical protein
MPVARMRSPLNAARQATPEVLPAPPVRPSPTRAGPPARTFYHRSGNHALPTRHTDTSMSTITSNPRPRQVLVVRGRRSGPARCPSRLAERAGGRASGSKPEKGSVQGFQQAPARRVRASTAEATTQAKGDRRSPTPPRGRRNRGPLSPSTRSSRSSRWGSHPGHRSGRVSSVASGGGPPAAPGTRPRASPGRRPARPSTGPARGQRRWPPGRPGPCPASVEKGPARRVPHGLGGGRSGPGVSATPVSD